jgi:hypothetical protein
MKTLLASPIVSTTLSALSVCIAFTLSGRIHESWAWFSLTVVLFLTIFSKGLDQEKKAKESAEQALREKEEIIREWSAKVIEAKTAQIKSEVHLDDSRAFTKLELDKTKADIEHRAERELTQKESDLRSLAEQVKRAEWNLNSSTAQMAALQENLEEAIKSFNDERESHSKSLSDAHKLVGSFRNLEAEFLCELSENGVFSCSFESLQDHLWETSEKMLTILREVMVSYYHRKGFKVNGDLSMAIKLLFKPSQAKALVSKKLSEEEISKIAKGDSVLVTVARDSNTRSSASGREIRGEVYGIRSNSAFNVLAQEHVPFFCENDLSSINSKYYTNDNPIWRKYYNATLAVPIRYKRPNSTSQKLFGFLCIDSQNEHKEQLFDGGDVFNLAALVADCYALNLTQLKVFTELGEILDPHMRIIHLPPNSEDTA